MPDQHRDGAAHRGYRIKVTRDGPYVVRGGVPLAQQIIVSDADGDPVGWREGENYATDPTYALCRCGKSAKWPFCDGQHARQRFDGYETAERAPFDQQAEETDGPDLRLSDVPILCANAGFCTRAGGTWELTKRSDEPEARRTAIEQASNCPSGRLVARGKDGQPIEPELEPSIGILYNPLNDHHGPIWVRGGIVIEAVDGTVYELRNRVTLCGCGESDNKPFCDGCHSTR